jgi:hypothetical protein
MDDTNIPQATPANVALSGSEHEPTSTGRLQTITEACSVMKDEIANEAQQTIFGTKKTGKQPTITEACLVMKDQMASEAHNIIGVDSTSARTPTVETGVTDNGTQVNTASAPLKNDSSGIANLDSEHLQRKELEQAKRALKEANWFEQ